MFDSDLANQHDPNISCSYDTVGCVGDDDSEDWVNVTRPFATVQICPHAFIIVFLADAKDAVDICIYLE